MAKPNNEHHSAENQAEREPLPIDLGEALASAVDPLIDGGPTDSAAADQATIQRLAALSPLDYDRVRDAEAKALGVRAATLDRDRKSTRLNPVTSASRMPSSA